MGMQDCDQDMPDSGVRVDTEQEKRFALGLSARQLQAFRAVAATLSFSQAAEAVSLSVPALSQRIRSLEQRLGHSVFNRNTDGISLTAAGRRLVGYAETVSRFEQELSHSLRAQHPGQLGGDLRIAGFSSVMRSVLMPALDGLVTEHPAVTLHFVREEMHRVQACLLQGEADLAVTHFHIPRAGLRSIQLGVERNYLIESSDPSVTQVDSYIDHDPDDHFTEIFLAEQGGIPANFRRLFYDEIYALLDAVERGVGRAVVPMHIISANRQIRPVSGYVAMDTPVVVSYRENMEQSRLIAAAIAGLQQHAPDLLARDAAGFQAQTGGAGIATEPYVSSSTL